MIYLRDVLLFGLVALHLTGGAILFRRIFPRESPWLGFILPALAIALACNFIEHSIALTWLHALLPLTTLGSAWLLISPKTNRRLLWKPTVVFLVALAIPFILRCSKPVIAIARDGPEDGYLIGNFCMGGTLPPESTWLPGFKLLYYYDFSHYAASVAIRLWGLDPGTGFNVLSALLAGLILFCTGAIAYRVSRRRLWVALLVILMTATAMDGITDDLWLNHPKYTDPGDATDLFNRCGPDGGAPYEKILPRRHDYWATHELIPPGYWSWIGSYHSATAGQFLVLFAVLCLVEMFHPRRTNWPWIGALWAPLLLLVSSTWGVPLAALIFLAGAISCARRGIYPRDWRFVLLAVAAAVTCLVPKLSYFLRAPTPPDSMAPDLRTPLLEFLMQWWPVYIPWLLLFFWWRRTHPAVRVLQIVLPLVLLGMEHCNFGARLDMTGKLWGDIFAAGWAAFLPALLALRSRFLYAVVALFFAATVISTCFWVDYYHRTIWWEDAGNLEGKGQFGSEPIRSRIFGVVANTQRQIIISDDLMLANLTHNLAYVGDAFTCTLFHPDAQDDAWTRATQVDNLFANKLPNPLDFLTTRHIAMIVIWPDRHLDPAILATLQTQLAPNYTYIDCRNPNPTASDYEAGVFVLSNVPHGPSPVLSPERAK
jgi:hypothetical protein